MGRFRHGFLSCKQKQKIASIRKGQNIRQTARTVLLDHAYTTSYPSSSYKQPDLSNFINEEVVDENNVNITSDDSWRNGRRVVELGVLADHLAACKQCGLPLSLQNCLNITTCGLAAVLKVLCVNQSCKNINAIPTGKQHNRIWDVNTKLATGKCNHRIPVADPEFFIDGGPLTDIRGGPLQSCFSISLYKQPNFFPKAASASIQRCLTL